MPFRPGFDAHLSLKNLADVYVGGVAAPEALHQRKRGHPLRKGNFDGPVAVAVALCHGERHRSSITIAPTNEVTRLRVRVVLIRLLCLTFRVRVP